MSSHKNIFSNVTGIARGKWTKWAQIMMESTDILLGHWLGHVARMQEVTVWLVSLELIIIT